MSSRPEETINDTIHLRSEAIRIVGVISDTHGVLRPQALAALQGSALILHAGDVGDVWILERLRRVAPVYAVRGNTDGGEVRAKLPATTVVDLGRALDDGNVGSEGGDLGGDAVESEPNREVGRGPVGPLAYVFHGDRELELDPRGTGIALVVSGHTHRPRIERRGSVLYVNPGSAGPRRFTLPVTVARVRVQADGEIDAEIVELEVE